MLRPDLARGVGESSNGLLSIRGSTRQEGVGWLAGEVGWLLGAGVGCWVLDAGVGSETLGCWGEGLGVALELGRRNWNEDGWSDPANLSKERI